MYKRIKQLISTLTKHKIDALLVTNDTDIFYLTGFPASESWLFISPQKVFYITDFRYVLEAQKGLHGITIKQYTKSIFETIYQTAKALNVKKIGFDERYLSLAIFKKLRQMAPKNIRLVAANHLVEKLRIIKDKNEVAHIRKALQLNLAAYKYLKGVIKPGKTEKEILYKLDQFVKSKGGLFSFDPIVASGPNSCLPHARVTNRKIRQMDVVLVDIGIDWKGYKSDLTRMFFLGKIPAIVKEFNSHVACAQKKAISKIRANVPAATIDREARNYLTKKGLGKYFGHSLGHGVGLEIHEAPTISQKSSAILKENMVFTVEPAVYIPNKFGIRIEDMVLVTKNGCEVLSQ